MGDSLDSQLRYGALGALRLDPLVVLGLIAGATKHVGLACTVSTTYFEPFAVARSMTTLDHLSGGRAAWNIVTSFQEAEARNFGRDEQLSRDRHYDRADEFMEVACALWGSWRDDALVRDRDTPLFADPSRIRRVDHDGKWFKVRGPLNVSRSPQGRPVFVQAGASERQRGLLAFGFGWIHGLGVAGGLGPLHLPAASLALALLSFSLGLEAAQIAIALAASPIAHLLRATPAVSHRMLPVLSGGVALLAVLWIERVHSALPPHRPPPYLSMQEIRYAA